MRDLWIHWWPLSNAQESVRAWTLWHCNSYRCVCYGLESRLWVYTRYDYTGLTKSSLGPKSTRLFSPAAFSHIPETGVLYLSPSLAHFSHPHLASNHPLFRNHTPAEEHYPLMARWNWCWCETFLEAVVQSEVRVKGTNPLNLAVEKAGEMPGKRQERRHSFSRTVRCPGSL